MSVPVCVQLKKFICLDELHYSSSHGFMMKMVIRFDLFTTLAVTKCAWFLMLSVFFAKYMLSAEL
jgi:hypothetical protein